MKLSIRTLAVLPCLAAFLLAAAPTANADSFSVSGSVWEIPTLSTVPPTGNSAYSATPTATFTVSNSSANNLFNFDSRGISGNATNYSLTSFLTSGGDGLAYITGSSHGSDLLNSPAGCGSNCTSNDLFQFTGSTTLTVGNYTTEHDDGLRLYLNGVDAFGGLQAGPTAPASTPFIVCAVAGSGCNAVAGTYSFVLDYAEVSGAPAVLETTLPLTATPEPSSFILLGTGLFAAAGLVRRRLSL